MSNHNEISSFIWRVCDDELRGLFKPHEYGEVILPFVVLRRLDCLLEPTKDEVVDLYNELKDQIDDPTPIIRKKSGLSFYNSSKFDLKRLKSDPNGLKMNFPNYLNGFSENVFQIIENFQLDKPVEKLLKNNKLYTLIDKFTEVDLHPEKVDNHTMGSIFEELLRKFSEMSNETSGEHYTPRDIVNLLVSLVFTGDEENLKGDGIIRTIFDPCCGTGGMLTIGKDWVNENVSQDVRFQLYGQELNPQTFSICKSDFLITGEEPNNIRLGSSLSDDQFTGRQFDYMITNPPFGVSWKSEKEFVLEENKGLGRFSFGVPRVSDGQLLFLQHMLSKLNESRGRIGVIFNGSPGFTGECGSGESEIRRNLFENDLVETIIKLPNELFFNTPISIYIWILTKNKSYSRRGKVQLINSESLFKKLRKPIGDKKKIMEEEHISQVIEIYKNQEHNENSLIVPNEHFGYKEYVLNFPKYLNGKPVYQKNKVVIDKSKKEFLQIPLNENINRVLEREIKYLGEDVIVDTNSFRIGYEVIFNKYFKPVHDIRTPETINKEINKLRII